MEGRRALSALIARLRARYDLVAARYRELGLVPPAFPSDLVGQGRAIQEMVAVVNGRRDPTAGGKVTGFGEIAVGCVGDRVFLGVALVDADGRRIGRTALEISGNKDAEDALAAVAILRARVAAILGLPA